MFLFDGGIPLAVSQKTDSTATTESLLGTRSENQDRQSDECDEEAHENERGNVFHARLAYIGGVSRPNQRGHSKTAARFVARERIVEGCNVRHDKLTSVSYIASSVSQRKEAAW